jgi:hypothetical protein
VVAEYSQLQNILFRGWEGGGVDVNLLALPWNKIH